MARLTAASAIVEGIVCCPECYGSLEPEPEPTTLLQCVSCHTEFPVVGGVPVLLPVRERTDTRKRDIQTFWRALYQEVYERADRETSASNLREGLEHLERMFRHRRHLIMTEMPIEYIAGKRVLEIGSGAGAHSALLSKHGAQVVSMDLTLERVVATANKLDLMDGHAHDLSLQADAEHLPFPDGTFDYVYSNGVLHHTPDTHRAVREVHRVLKPAGEAVIMLYARDSFQFWVVLFLLRGLLLGGMLRSRYWLARATEWMARSKQRVFNPETKVYSRAQIRRLFADFRSVAVRKSSFEVQVIPGVGKSLSRLIGRRTGFNPGGILVYGEPWRNECRSELMVGRYIGFDLNIRAAK